MTPKGVTSYELTMHPSWATELARGAVDDRGVAVNPNLQPRGYIWKGGFLEKVGVVIGINARSDEASDERRKDGEIKYSVQTQGTVLPIRRSL